MLYMVTFTINIPPMLVYIYQHHGSYGNSIIFHCVTIPSLRWSWGLCPLRIKLELAVLLLPFQRWQMPERTSVEFFVDCFKDFAGINQLIMNNDVYD